MGFVAQLFDEGQLVLDPPALLLRQTTGKALGHAGKYKLGKVCKT
jgi:hypothetical protein